MEIRRVWRALGAGSTLVLGIATAGCSPRLAAPAAHQLLEALFAPPTEAERAAVRAEWRRGEAGPEKVRVEWERRERNGRRTLVVSHEVNGERHFGAVRVPPGERGRRLPVLVIAHGGQLGASGYHFLRRGPFATEWIQVVPSFRSEPLFLTPLRIYRSEGTSNPWAGDVEDSMALLGAALALIPEADSSRVAVTGHSRGGAVALLMGIRDPRVKAVVSFAAPTDLFLPEVRRIAERGLRMPLPPLPGAGYLADSVLFAYRDGRIPLERARLELLRRSPAWFADALPPTQVHHGALDGTVPYAHGEQLRRLAERLSAAQVEFHGYAGGRHRTRTLEGAMERAERFLTRAVTAAAVDRGRPFLPSPGEGADSSAAATIGAGTGRPPAAGGRDALGSDPAAEGRRLPLSSLPAPRSARREAFPAGATRRAWSLRPAEPLRR